MKKIVIAVIVLLVLGAAGLAGYRRWSNRDLVTVQTSKIARGDLTQVVTASGEIKPKTYINLGANAQGILEEIIVHEGEYVRQGQVVAKIENIQATADVAAQRATVNAALSDASASEEAIKQQDETIKTQVVTVERGRVDQERAQVNYDRAKQLFDQQVGPRQDMELRLIDLNAAKAAMREAEARMGQLTAQKAQLAAQLASAQRRVAQAQAQLTRIADVLAKHDVIAPINGLVTNLPVRVGETVVPGIQNSSASTIMTVADMSQITAELKVDETDIVNIKLGQIANVTIDAINGKTFQGKVVEIGNSALLRSSGLAASQSTTSSQEAKDFKVVVAIDNPPSEIRPGLSCSAKVVVAVRKDVLMLPLQALTVRTKGDLEDAAKEREREKNKTDKKEDTNAPLDPAQEKIRKEEIQGVFLVNGDRADFHKVETGITGETDIELLGGLQPGDQIVTGSYKAIRSMKDGARIKIDNQTQKKDDSKS